MDTNLLVGKFIDGKEVVGAKFDELSQFTTVYFNDGNFRVFTKDEDIAFEGETDVEMMPGFVITTKSGVLTNVTTAETGTVTPEVTTAETGTVTPEVTTAETGTVTPEVTTDKTDTVAETELTTNTPSND